MKINGMSLLEVLISVSIMAILATLAIPSYVEWRTSAEFKHVLEQASSLARYGRALALTERTAVTLVLDSSQSGCLGLTSEDDCNCHQANHCQLSNSTKQLSMQRYNATLSTSKSAKDSSKLTLTFDGTHGLNFGNALSVSITRAPYNGKLIISNLGRIRYCTSTPLTGISPC